MNLEKFTPHNNSHHLFFHNRKHVVFGKLVDGQEVLRKIENAGDEDGRPAVTVKIIYCGEYEGKSFQVAVCVESNACETILGINFCSFFPPLFWLRFLVITLLCRQKETK